MWTYACFHLAAIICSGFLSDALSHIAPILFILLISCYLHLFVVIHYVSTYKGTNVHIYHI